MLFINQTTIFFSLVILLNIGIFFKINWFVEKINIYDKPDLQRKIHKKSTSLFGGILVFINILFFLLYFAILDINVLISSLNITEIKTICIFIFILLLIFFTGLYDDKFLISSKKRFFLFILLIYFLVLSNDTLYIEKLDFTFTDYELYLDKAKIIFPCMCLIIFLISSNMYDGINLQSFIFYFVNFMFLFTLNYNPFILLIIISLLFFGILNYKGRVFLGDSGVYLLSIILGYYCILYFNIKFEKIYSDQMFLLLLLPVLDATRVILFRLLKNKDGFLPDKTHFHHLLLNKYNYRKTIFILLIFNLFPILSYYTDLNNIISICIILFVYFYFLFNLRAIKT